MIFANKVSMLLVDTCSITDHDSYYWVWHVFMDLIFL